MVKSKIKAKFLWELINESEKLDECGVNFKISYDIFDFPCSYSCEFKLSNFTVSIDSCTGARLAMHFLKWKIICRRRYSQSSRPLILPEAVNSVV